MRGSLQPCNVDKVEICRPSDLSRKQDNLKQKNEHNIGMQPCGDIETDLVEGGTNAGDTPQDDQANFGPSDNPR